MKTRLISLLGVALAIAACSSTTSEPASQAADAAASTSTATTPMPEGQPVAAGTSTPAGASSAAVPSETSSPIPADPAGPSHAEYQEVIVPNGTTLALSLMTPIASDTSAVDEPVRAELAEAVAVDGRNVLPVGTQVEGYVTDVDRSGRVTGRATITFQLTTISVGGERYELQAAPVSEMAPATRGEDARTIGIGAGAGALIGGLLGGADGAAKGAAVGGGAGTGVVLATRGDEVRLAAGAPVVTELTSALTVVVPAD